MDQAKLSHVENLRRGLRAVGGQCLSSGERIRTRGERERGKKRPSQKRKKSGFGNVGSRKFFVARTGGRMDTE